MLQLFSHRFVNAVHIVRDSLRSTVIQVFRMGIVICDHTINNGDREEYTIAWLPRPTVQASVGRRDLDRAEVALIQKHAALFETGYTAIALVHFGADRFA